MLTLTSGNDTVTGGANTLNATGTNDLILDASTADTDTATLTVNASATPTISNVENITLNYALGSGTVTASSISGDKQITLGSFEAGSTAAAVDGIKTGKTFVVDNAVKTVTLTTNSATDNSEAATVKFQGNTATLTTNATNDFDQLTINSTGAANTVTLATVADVFSATNESITVTGDQKLTLKSADVGTTGLNGATVTKSLTGTATLVVELNGALNAATQDLSKVQADQFVISTASTTAASTVTVATGSSIKLSADFGAGHATGMTLASKTADGTLSLNATASQTNRVNVNSAALVNVSVTDTVTIADLTLGNAGGLTAAKVAISGTDTAKTLTLSSVSAKEVDASALTGKLIVTTNTVASAKLTGGTNDDQINNGNVAGVTVDGGGGNDTITIGGANGGTFKGGEGSDTFNISAAANLVGTFDGGNGSDTLAFTAGAGAGNRDVSGVAFTLTGIELIDLGAGANATHTVTFKGAQLTGQTLNIVDTVSTAAAVAVNVAAAGTAENIDLSNINTTLAITLTGSNLADILKGTKGADSIIGGTGADTMTGGNGADQFTVVLSATEVDTITDFVGGSDKVQLGSGATASTVLKDARAILSAAQQTTLDAQASVAAAAADVATNFGTYSGATYTAANHDVLLFTYKGDAFAYYNADTTAAVAATDVVVKITGVTGTVVAGDFVHA